MSVLTFTPNDGKPPITDAQSVYVELRNGIRPESPWPVFADKAHRTRWTLTGHPFDITGWKEA